jgi:hypothetical protein
MFERSTDRARRVLVCAQEEARLLNHNFIGTEHILLGLIREGDGVAAQVLASLDIGLQAVREKVEETIGPAGASLTGSPPFTPRAKKVLELSLREALQLGHNYIGTEHILLGLVREGEGVEPGALRCARCGAALADSARYRSIEAGPGDEADEGHGQLSATVLYCSRCGGVIGPVLETGSVLRVPLTSTVQVRPAPAAPPLERRFSDELLAPRRGQDVPEEARVDLVYRSTDVLEGTVGGTAVRIRGRVGAPRWTGKRDLGRRRHQLAAGRQARQTSRAHRRDGQRSCRRRPRPFGGRLPDGPPLPLRTGRYHR